MFGISGDFPATPAQTWREQVEKDLAGASFEKKLVHRTLEGIAIQPLYTQDTTGRPLPPARRHSHTQGKVSARASEPRPTCQLHAHPDPTTTAQAIREDVAGGCRALEIVLRDPSMPPLFAGPSLRDGLAPDLGSGIAVEDLATFESLLSAVPLPETILSISAGSRVLGAAACVAAVWRRRGVDPTQCVAFFNSDPLGAAARGAEVDLDRSLMDLVALSKWTAATFPMARAVRASCTPYADAGANAAQGLGYALATALESMRAMTNGGLTPTTAAHQISFLLDLDCTFFMEIAKLRALRWLWSAILERCGVHESERGAVIHVRTARRVLTERDPWVNMLRSTTTAFAGAIAGADLVILEPFDALVGPPDELARRVARNTQHILSLESHLDHVVDPAGGSWFLEALTEDIARAAWTTLRSVETSGGMRAALCSGEIRRQIDSVHELRKKEIARRKIPITGVSEFPNLREAPLERGPTPSHMPIPETETLLENGKDAPRRSDPGAREAAPAQNGAPTQGDGPTTRPRREPNEILSALLAGAPLSAYDLAHERRAPVEALPIRRFAEPFERLRRASDAYLAKHGERPSVFLANLGPTAEHTPRTSFTQNFLEAGGLEPKDRGSALEPGALPAMFLASGAKVAVLCGADSRYKSDAVLAVRALKGQGAKSVLMAGRPGEIEPALLEAGVDDFVFVGCDIQRALERLHEILEIDR